MLHVEMKLESEDSENVARVSNRQVGGKAMVDLMIIKTFKSGNLKIRVE